jgi:hypothetical protein
MTTKDAATERPWASMGSRGDIKSVCKGFPEKMVAKVLGQATTEERAANAALIVEAVNSHASLLAKNADLIKALEEMTAAFEGLRPFPLVVDAVAQGLIANARAAIGKARTSADRVGGSPVRDERS